MLKVFAIASLCAAAALAQNNAVGNWQFVDGTKTTFITTTEEGGQLKAKVTKVTKDGKEDPSAACGKCTEANKDKPLAGLQILWDTKKDGNNWKEGKLLDPEGGKIVKGAVEVLDGGKKLNVKASIAFLSKTQVWVRVP